MPLPPFILPPEIVRKSHLFMVLGGIEKEHRRENV